MDATGAALVALTVSEEDSSTKFTMSLLVATMPTLFVKRVSYYLLACPCLLHDESATSEAYTTVRPPKLM